MNLEDIKKQRKEALLHAYHQLMKVLNKDLDLAEVDPEKIKTSLIAYRQAADDSEHILNQLTKLMEEDGELVVKKKKDSSAGLSPESRDKK